MGAPQRTDLVAGITAALAFLALAFALHFNIFVSAALAVGTYAGIRMLLTERPAAPPPPRPLREVLNELYTLIQSLPPTQVRQKVIDIHQQASTMLAYFNENPSEAAVWDDIVRDCLDSTLRLVRRYAGLARHLQPGEEGAVRELTDVLNNVAQTLGAMRQRLLQSDAAGLEEDLKAFKSTLAAVNEVVEVQTVRQGDSPS